MSLEVDIVNEQRCVSIDAEYVQWLVSAVIDAEGQSCHEVAVHFVTKERIQELHQQFFQDPTPTDCISLPVDGEEEEYYRHLGDVFVCPEVAVEYVVENGGDVEREVYLYVIHGLLHLLGYDDIDPEECKKMREAEKRHMELIGEKF